MTKVLMEELDFFNGGGLDLDGGTTLLIVGESGSPHTPPPY